MPVSTTLHLCAALASLGIVLNTLSGLLVIRMDYASMWHIFACGDCMPGLVSDSIVISMRSAHSMETCRAVHAAALTCSDTT